MIMSESDSDEWGAEELVIPVASDDKFADGNGNSIKNNNDGESNSDEWGVEDGGDDYWDEIIIPNKKKEKKEPKVEQQQKSGSKKEGEPMIIVDLTQINPNVHNKFDRNSVNDPEVASAMRKKIEDDYQNYASSYELLVNSTVVPCGSSVWRDALIQLRNDRPGHYFVPIFKKKA